MNIDMVIRFLNHTEPKYLLLLIVKIVLLISVFLFLKKYRPRWKNFGYAVLLVFCLRLFLFDQYVSWGYYLDHLTVDDIGWRQMNVLEYEKNKFSKKENPIKFFAVGSSQTHAVYAPYSEKNKELEVFYMSAMAPLDLYLYRKYIVSHQAKYLLLYLSEFDLAKVPRLEAAKLAPNQGFDLLKIFPLLSEISKKKHSEIDLREMVVGEFFPEYKYSFIFRGFSEKLMRKNKALHIESLLKALEPDSEQTKRDSVDMLEEWDESWIKYNKYFLTQFLSYCRNKFLKVIIIEGQYHPWAYTEKSMYLNQITRRELESVANTFDNVVFLPRSNVIRFTEQDYSDATHVKAGPANDFVKDVLKKIDISYVDNKQEIKRNRGL